MDKLEKLSPEQELLMHSTREEWTNRFFEIKEINKPQFETGIKWLYEDILKKKTPKIIYCDSWISCLITIGILKNKASVGTSVGTVRDSVRDSVGTVGDSVGDSVAASVWDSVAASVGDSVGDSVGTVRDSVRDSVGTVGDSVGDSVAASVWASVAASVWASVGDSVRDSVGTVRASVRDSVGTVGDSVAASVWASVGDSVRDSVGASVWEHSNYLNSYGNWGFCAFYDYFEKIGVLKNDKFSKYKNLILSGAFQVYEYENFIFAIQPPIEIHRNSEGMLHNVNGIGVKFRDGSGYYYINGRNMPAWVFEDVKFDQFLKEENEDIKAGIITRIKEIQGNEGLLNFLNAKLIDTQVLEHENGHRETIKLYKTKESYSFLQDHLENTNVPYAWVEMQCPSTFQSYLIDTSAYFTNALDAIKFLRPAPIPMELKYNHSQFAN